MYIHSLLPLFRGESSLAKEIMVFMNTKAYLI